MPSQAIENHGQGIDPSETSDLFRIVFEHAPLAIWVTGMDTHFLRVNGAVSKLLGYSSEELVGTSWTRLTHPDDLGYSLTDMKELIHGPNNFKEIKKRFIHRSGAVVWARLRISLVQEHEHSQAYFVVHVEDITDTRRVSEALRESEERFRNMANSCPSMLWVTGTAGNIEFINDVFRAFCGISYEVSESSNWKVPLHADDEPQYMAALHNALTEHSSFRAEARIKRADGAWRLIGSRAEPRLSSVGEYMGHIGLSTDITDRVLAEEAHQLDFSLLRSINEETQEGILVVNGAGVIVSRNKRFLEIWQIEQPINGVQPDPRIEVFDDSELLRAALERVESSDEFISRIQYLYEHKDESDHSEIKLKDGRTLERHSTGLRNKDGNYLGRVWFFRDITTGKQAELSLKNAKDLADENNHRLLEKRASLDAERNILRTLIDNIPDFMYVKDTESKFIVANAHLAHMVGAESADELVGKSDFDLYPVKLARLFYQDDQDVINSGKPLYNREEEGLDSAGNAAHVLTTKVPLRNKKGDVIGIAGVGRDISTRKKMEDALRDAERKYREIFDNAVVGIFQSTLDGRFLSVNTAMASKYGYDSPEDMIASVTDIALQCYADPGSRTELVVSLCETGFARDFTCEALRKDGSKFWVTMNMQSIRRDGVVVRYDGMCEDNTDLILTRQQLLQAQKLESVGQLAAGIAHEINTPTQYIGDNVRFLKDAFADLMPLLAAYERLLIGARDNTLTRENIDEVEAAVKHADTDYLLEEIPKAVEQTLEGIARVAKLVNAMKEFSHPGTKEKVLLDLNHAIDSTITVARNEWKYVADLETDFDASLPLVPCHPGEFNQVVLNLIVNAAQAIADVLPAGSPKKGLIKLQTRSFEKWVEIRVEDTGGGIPDRIRSRIFDPFFTTKEIGKGTGQGLAIARSVVVDKHGGTIHFETKEGKGTTFIIRLPLDGKDLPSKAVIA